jgi:hypothetical protein
VWHVSSVRGHFEAVEEGAPVLQKKVGKGSLETI